MPTDRRLAWVPWLALGLPLLALLIDATLIEPRRLVVRELDIPCPSLERRPVRIALFSDVSFDGVGRREERLRRRATEFDPHLVLVAGDLLGGWGTFARPEVLREAAEWVESIPASHGRYLVPGEEESFHARRLRQGWISSETTWLVNESVSLEIEGERIELFGADQNRDAAPWTVGREVDRSFVESGSRPREHRLLYDSPAADAWEDVEIEFSFQPREPWAYVELLFSWQVDDEGRGSGWRLLSYVWRRSLRLRPLFEGRHQLTGRLDSGFVPLPGTWTHGRVRLSDDGEVARVRARFWPEWAPEPARWAIDASDRGPDRRHRGTIALGGRDGRRRYGPIRVRDATGSVLFEDDFDRGPGPTGDGWRQPSRLGEWLASSRSARGVRLLLGHHPDLALDVIDFRMPPPDLMLAGHTHGGQVRLPGIGALFTATRIGRRYDQGLFDFHGVPLFITSGVGTSVVPIRLLNPPELVLLTLTPPARPGGG